MNLIISFRSELIKIRRTSAWYLGAAVALLTPFMMCVDYFSGAGLPEEMKVGNPWNYYFSQSFLMMTLLELPLLVILMCTLVPQVEFRNHTWKQVLASPQAKLNIYLAKFGSILVLVLLFFLAHTIFTLLAAVIIDAGQGNERVFMVSAFPLDDLLTYNLRAVVCSLGLIACQFWFGIRFKNFIAPIAIGLFIWFVGGMVSLELKLPWGNWNPYILPGYATFTKFQDQLPVLILKSVGFCIAFLTVGFIDFSRKRMHD